MEVGAVAGLDGVGAGVIVAPGVMALCESSLRDDLGVAAAERGYVFVRGLVDRRDIRALRRRVLEVCDDLGWLADGPPVGRGVVRPGVRVGVNDAVWTEMQARVVVLPEFDRLRGNGGIRGILERLFGGEVRSGCGDVCRVFSPGAPELTTRPHQDGSYLRDRPGLWTVWIPLGDCPVELGGLAVLPGSHRGGLRPHTEDGVGGPGVGAGPDLGWASADYRCGDVLFVHGMTLHRALDNRSEDRLRVSADFRYEPVQAPEEASERGGGSSDA